MIKVTRSYSFIVVGSGWAVVVLTLRTGCVNGIKQMQVHVIFAIAVIVINKLTTSATIAATATTTTRGSRTFQAGGHGFSLQFQYTIDRLILL